MYTILLTIWSIARIIREHRLFTFTVCAIACFFSSGIFILTKYLIFHNECQFARLFFMFFSGATFYVLKKYIHLTRSFLWPIVILLFFSVGNKHLFYVVYTLSIAYLVFYSAYVPSGYVRKYNLLGDYSYGIYIYAFPVQQSVAALIPGVSVLHMIFISACVTILLAAISWHILEKRALGLKGSFADCTRRLFLYAREHVGVKGLRDGI